MMDGSVCSLLLLALIVVTCQPAKSQGGNLLRDPDFEGELKNNWKTTGANMARTFDVSEVRTGQYAVKLTNRKNQNSGILQLGIPFYKGRHYVFEGYVKLLNDQPGVIWQVIKANIQITLANSSKQSYNIAYRSFCESAQGWIRLRGDIEAPQVDFSDARIIVRGPAQEVNFLVDNFTLFEEPEDPLWRQKADINIETQRKSNVRLNVQIPPDVMPNHINVEVELKSHKFAFGSMMRADQVLIQPTNELMKLAYYMFNWGTIQNYKWKFHKGNRLNNSDLSIAVDATKIMRKHGIKVRGHSIFWNVEKNIPKEVLALTGPELKVAINRHLEHVINKSFGLLEQWDVQNEYIAGHYFEEKTQDRHMTKKIFINSKTQGDRAALYLNDFQCITSGAQTEQYYDLAKEFLDQGVPLEGLGIQGHTKEYVKPDPTAMWRRINRLAELGLPLMMTEFDIGWPLKAQRADWLEDAVRAFFGNPNLAGIILWDFYSGTMRDPDHELVSGTLSNLVIEESGQRWVCLVKKEWTTKLNFNMARQSGPFDFRGFKGDYQVLVKRKNVVVQKETMSVGDTDTVWNLRVTSNQTPVPVEQEMNYVPECVSHRDSKTLGKVTSNMNSGSLTCRTAMSQLSGNKEDDSVSVSCRTGEVMTGCTSSHTELKWARKGERIEVDPVSGIARCTAVNGKSSGAPVRAYARCCNLTGLTCDYKTAGPSFHFKGAMAESSCRAGQQALGCSIYSPVRNFLGVISNDGLTGCRAHSGDPVNPIEKSGVYAYSACCKTDRPLQCSRVESSLHRNRGVSTARVECPPNTVMTDCNAFFLNGNTAGAEIGRNGKTAVCVASLPKTVNIPNGSPGVRAHAVCCAGSEVIPATSSSRSSYRRNWNNWLYRLFSLLAAWRMT